MSIVMFWATVLCLVLLGKAVRGNWEDGSDDPSFSKLGFYVRNTTCNDQGSQCMDCYTGRDFGLVFLHTFEYSEKPFKFLFRSTSGTSEWRILYTQEERKPFRLCTVSEDEHSNLPGDTSPVVHICMDNNFSEMSVPAECPHPIVAITLTAVHGDERLRGVQALHCMSPN